MRQDNYEQSIGRNVEGRGFTEAGDQKPITFLYESGQSEQNLNDNKN
jgi:hypothetical protein